VTPVSPLILTQKLVGPKSKDYPYALEITIQTDHEISNVSIAIIFARGELDPAHSFVSAGIAVGPSMTMGEHASFGKTKATGQPVMLVQFTSNPPLDPSHPLLVTVQSKTDIWAQSAEEYRP
jgi:hypothetical protein